MHPRYFAGGRLLRYLSHISFMKSLVCRIVGQKLSFFAHGYYLASSGVPLIEGSFQAWPFGPVNPTIYEAFKHYGAAPMR